MYEPTIDNIVDAYAELVHERLGDDYETAKAAARNAIENERQKALRRIRLAWTVQGANPSAHRFAQTELMRTWPFLAQAITAAVRGEGEQDA